MQALLNSQIGNQQNGNPYQGAFQLPLVTPHQQMQPMAYSPVVSQPSQPQANIFQPQTEAPKNQGINFWEEELKILSEVASLELTGLCLYTFLEASISGISSPPISAQFGMNSTEAQVSYQRVLGLIQRLGRELEGGIACPVNEMLSQVQSGKPEACIGQVLEYETRITAVYSDLLSLVKEKDYIVEYFCINRLTIKSQQITELKKLTK
ncbi:hypothetical protein K9N68_37270 (plasmid) [Kovacikia minuta CCNUW1]|uniref:hypothetical protein n=1 Tax=Kovacikia minuta TaxID=2931930 RepID=UPI001CCE2EB0|nr:hypothetical protein [Kovacikia minuta]UBF29864.1 hypothetical protein K9N68_37270 [Kovacikia minuta CCNUW1]